jgi:hypothetical protein
MDITHLTVEGHPINSPGERTLQEELQDIEDRFSEVNKVPPLAYLKKRIIKKLIESRGQ